MASSAGPSVNTRETAIRLLSVTIARISICARCARANSARWRALPNRSNYSGETIAGRPRHAGIGNRGLL
jgi:hypothetical protein